MVKILMQVLILQFKKKISRMLQIQNYRKKVFQINQNWCHHSRRLKLTIFSKSAVPKKRNNIGFAECLKNDKFTSL